MIKIEINHEKHIEKTVIDGCYTQIMRELTQGVGLLLSTMAHSDKEKYDELMSVLIKRLPTVEMEEGLEC